MLQLDDFLLNQFSRFSRRQSGDNPDHGIHLEALEPRILFDINPSGLEQELLEHLNRFRMFPAEELGILTRNLRPARSNDRDVNRAMKFFKVDGNVLASQWQSLDSVQPLGWNEKLYNAAAEHNQLMIQFDEQSHQLPGEQDLADRIDAAGYDTQLVGENVFSFAESTFHGHAGFAIDWGPGPDGIQDPPGHRDVMTNEHFREIGISIQQESNRFTEVGPLVMTQDFGVPQKFGNSLLLGVVYGDADTNGFYTAGEGLGNIHVDADGTGGHFESHTMSAGGYQIKVPTGTYTMTFTGGNLWAPIVVPDVAIGNQNVKVDAVNVRRPDLAVDSFNFPASTFSAGDIIEGSFVGQNQGNAAIPRSSDFDFQAILSTDMTWGNADDIMLQPGPSLTKSNGLDIGHSTTVNASLAIPANTLSGDYFIAVMADSGQSIEELFEDNNIAWSDTATVRIRPRVTLTATIPQGFENDVATPAIVTATRDGPTDATLFVFFSVTGTATAGADYFGPSQPFIFLPGQSSATVQTMLMDDDETESNETIIFTLDQRDAYEIGDADSAVVTILDDDAFTIEMGNGLPGSLIFSDDGTHVTVTISKAAAMVSFAGDNLNTSAAGKNVKVTGNNLAVISINISGSSKNTRLNIKGKGANNLVSMGSINVDSEIKSIIAKGANFLDAAITINGPITKFHAHDVINTDLFIQNVGAAYSTTKIQFADAQDFTIDSQVPLDIRGNSYVNSHPDVDGVTTVHLNSARIKNGAAFAATITDSNDKGLSFKKGKFGNFTGGTWTVAGGGGRFNAESIDHWTADFEGFFKSIKSRTTITNSEIELGSAKTIVAKTDIIDSNFLFTDLVDSSDPKQRAFKKFKAHRLIESVKLQGNTSFGRIEAGQAVNFNVRLAVSDLVPFDSLASAANDFEHQAVIDKITFKAIEGDPIAMDNVFINAHTISRISARQAAGGLGDPFGFAAVSYPRGVNYKDDQGSNTLTNNMLSVGANPVNASYTRLTVNLLV